MEHLLPFYKISWDETLKKYEEVNKIIISYDLFNKTKKKKKKSEKENILTCMLRHQSRNCKNLKGGKKRERGRIRDVYMVTLWLLSRCATFRIPEDQETKDGRLSRLKHTCGARFDNATDNKQEDME